MIFALFENGIGLCLPLFVRTSRKQKMILLKCCVLIYSRERERHFQGSVCAWLRAARISMVRI